MLCSADNFVRTEVWIFCKEETNDRVIRIAPPLLISRDGIDWAFERITKLIGKS